MASHLLAVTLSVAFGLLGCKSKGEADSVPHASDAAAATGANPTPSSPDPADPAVDPDFDLAIDLDTGDPEPVAPVPISEGGTSLFDPESDADAPVSWNVSGTEIALSTAEVGRSDEAVDIQIKMASGGNSQLVTTCRGLDVAGGSGKATAHLAGDVAIIACTTGSGSAQRSWGVRLALDPASGLVREIGRFENQGPPAIDSRDAGAAGSP
jgi:hypothetical protein